MYYLLLYRTVEDYVNRRQPHREAHLAYANAAKEKGELIMAGAFHPADGAALVFKGNNAEVARNFAANDPYVLAGLITAWEVKEWKVVVSAKSVGSD